MSNTKIKKKSPNGSLSNDDVRYMCMSDMAMAMEVKTHFKTKEKNRYDILKNTIKYGMNVNDNVPGTCHPWIFYAVELNDIILLGHILRADANINKLVYGNNVLHQCVTHNRTTLLEYFIKRGVDINQINDDNCTPFELACDDEETLECAKILIEQPNIKLYRKEEQFSSFVQIISNIMGGKKKYKELLQIYLKKATKFHKKDMTTLNDMLHDNFYEELGQVLTRFPHLVNKTLDRGNTIGFICLNDGHYEFFNFVIKVNGFDYTKTNINGISYIHLVCSLGLENEISEIINSYPDCCDIRCEKGMTPIDYLLTSLVIEDNKKIIDLIEHIHSKKNISKRTTETLELAIRYRSREVVEKMINLGYNITGNLVKNEEYPPTGNNDLIGLAIQTNNYETTRMLIEKGVQLHKIYYKGHTIYTSVLLAIMFQRIDILEGILFSIPEIKKTITPKIKVFLLDYAIKNGVIDRNTLDALSVDSEIVKVMEFENEGLEQNRCEKIISRHFKKYINFSTEEKTKFLKLLCTLLSIFTNIIDVDFDNILRPLSGAISFYENIMENDNLDINCVDIFFNIICEITDFHNINSIKECLALVYSIETCHLCEYHTNELLKKINVTTKWFSDDKIFLDKLYVVYNLYKRYETQGDKEYKNNIVVVRQQNNNKKNIAIKSLFKLYWPVKVSHYQYMYDNIINNRDTIIENNDNLIIIGKNSVKSTVLKSKSINLNVPSRWINTYSPNIGSEEKDDYNHSFSFLLDKLLQSRQCIELTADDPTHEGGKNKMLYFYGVIQYGDIIDTGCYEYFINSYGTLFHRMFRPFGSLPREVKNKLEI